MDRPSKLEQWSTRLAHRMPFWLLTVVVAVIVVAGVGLFVWTGIGAGQSWAAGTWWSPVVWVGLWVLIVRDFARGMRRDRGRDKAAGDG